MERLGKKLRSERGASILLALLMFLVCAMVGATVLAAAVSNAGKARSNRTEQQKFLNLTSAVQLVADEIANKATYTGKYTVWEWEEVETVKETDTSVTPHLETTVSVTKESYFYCMQTEGEYSCGDLDAQLPFQPRLEELFGDRFAARGAGFERLSVPTPAPAGQYDLRVTLEGLPDDAPEGYKVPGEVTIRVKLDGDTHHILLTAWEGKDIPADPADPMGTAPDLSKAVQAELVAREGTVLDYNPGSRKAGTLKDDGPGGKTFPDPKPDAATGNKKTTYEIVNTEMKSYPDSTGKPLRWELSWIRKGGAAP